MKNKPIFTAIALVALILILAGGAFTAMQLLAADDSETAAAEGEGIRVMESVMDNGDGNPISVRTKILPAEELPDEPAAAGGVLISRSDNTLMVGTGNVDLEVNIEVDPSTGRENVSLIPSTDGPELEVVVGVDTILYNDVTDLTADPPTESGEREVVQQLRPAASLEEMPEQAEIQVWGERRGDRIIATIVVFGPLGGGAFQ